MEPDVEAPLEFQILQTLTGLGSKTNGLLPLSILCSLLNGKNYGLIGFYVQDIKLSLL